MKFKELDVVKVVKTKYDSINEGEIGTVVSAFTVPNEAYEVEFVNKDGTTKDILVFQPDELEIQWRSKS